MVNSCEIIISCILVPPYISPDSCSFWNLIAHYSDILVGFCAACNNYWSLLQFRILSKIDVGSHLRKIIIWKNSKVPAVLKQGVLTIYNFVRNLTAFILLTEKLKLSKDLKEGYVLGVI